MAIPVVRAVRVGLAVHRLTRLVVEDEIMRPARLAVDEWAKDADMFTPRERVATLIQCKRCVSIWAAAAVIALEATRPGRILTSILAASDAGILLDLLEADE
ncbi:MAG TPA: DUF1360 domain-containing protein [Microlunatus sp.]